MSLRDGKIWRFRVPLGTKTKEGTTYSVDIIHGERYYALVDANRLVTLVPAELLEDRVAHAKDMEPEH